MIYFTPFNLYFSLFCLNDDFRVIAAEAKQHDCEEKVFVQKLSRKCFELFPFRGLPPSLPPSVEERGRQFRHENKQRPSPGAAIKRRGENRRATHWLTAADGREREREREGGQWSKKCGRRGAAANPPSLRNKAMNIEIKINSFLSSLFLSRLNGEAGILIYSFASKQNCPCHPWMQLLSQLQSCYYEVKK